MNWSAEQLRMLDAMGLDVMVLASAGTQTQPVSQPTASADTAMPGVPANAADFAVLLQALRRAAGDRDVSALIDDIARLRREPLLKRALWPQLRALRRSH
jgi:hypothetical protein